VNPGAIEWLESLGEGDGRTGRFSPIYPYDGQMFSLKDDHEDCTYCTRARHYGELLVIE
jgi:hypothetical protein